VLIWAAAAWGLHRTAPTLLLFLVAYIAFSLVLGIPAATIAARESNRKYPSFVVIDEVAGQWVALLGCRPNWRLALIVLLLFRFFEVIKPFPTRQLEQLPGGWGIVLDDVAAGLYAWVVAFALHSSIQALLTMFRT
jgi:phosphatidylglycerophosphatase A